MNKSDGMNAAAAAEERSNKGFQDRALEAIRDVAERKQKVHVDDVLAVFTETPSHPNAWGAVWTKARRLGLIVPSGMVKPTMDPRKKGHNYPVYFSLVWYA